jgi:hypothetical protein
MKTLLAIAALLALAGQSVCLAQDAGSQKTSNPQATFIIKVQDVAVRNAVPFTDKINAIEGMSVKDQCKSKLKDLSYVLIELDKHRFSTMDAALKKLEEQGLSFKPLNRPESDFGTICDNN